MGLALSPSETTTTSSLKVNTTVIEEFESPIAASRSANIQSSGQSALHVAVHAGDIQGTTKLLDEGHSIDIEDENGSTPLHIAAALRAAEPRGVLVEILLDKRADVHQFDKEGCTCLHVAATLGHVDVIETVMAAGADPHSRTSNGETPLHRAAQYGRVECVRALMQHGGSRLVLEQNHRWETALDVASASHTKTRASRAQVREAILEV